MKRVLFLSRGRTIRFHNLFEEELPSILKSYAEKGFTGRLIIYLDDYTIELDLQRGRIVAALAEEKTRGNIIRGEEAINVLRERIREKNGYVEVLELSDEKIQIDLDYAPDARIPETSSKELLGLEAKPEPVETSRERQVPPAEELGGKFSHEALSLARDVAALLRIVLHAEKSAEITGNKLSQVITALSESRGTYSIAYARCITRHNRVINIVCTKTGCAAADANGNYVEELEEPMTCKIYFAP